MKFKTVFLSLLFATLFFSACKEDDQIGSSVQPEEDMLKVYSNMVYVGSHSLLTDSVLSKSSSLFFGRYRDAFFGETVAEFATQFDSRLGFGGLMIPDTTVGGHGVSPIILKGLDEAYGDIISVTSPSNERVDSVVFVMQYTDNLLGDTVPPQKVAVYELNEALVAGEKYYTNADISKYCKKNILLGETIYQIANNSSREVRVSFALFRYGYYLEPQAG